MERVDERKRVREDLDGLPERDVQALMRDAVAAGRAGLARKAGLVDARPARPGEIVVTEIAGEGYETRSRPAARGDWLVRNRSPAGGNECYLVGAAAFRERYEGPLGKADGWQLYRPKGKLLRYTIVRLEDGTFRFMAPWGETMIARPGDAVVQDPAAPIDTYRVAARVFAESYEIVLPAG